LKKLVVHPEFMKYFSNTSWLLFDKLFKMSVGFFIIVYLTRYLGPEQFGIFSYAQSFISIFMALSSLGISQILIRDLVDHSDRKNIFLGSAFFITLISSLIVVIMIILFSKIFVDESITQQIIIILSFMIIFQNFNRIIDAYFQHKVLSKKIVYSSTIGFTVYSLFRLYLIYIEADLIYFAWALLFNAFLLSVLFVYIYIKEESSLKWSIDTKLMKEYLRSAIPLTIVAVSVFMYNRIDQVMLKHMLGNEVVGNYSAAIKVSELFYFLPGIIMASLYPKLIEVKKESEERYLRLLERSYRLMIWISVPIALFLFIFSDFIIATLYGERFMQASSVLKVLAWSIIFTSIGTVFVKILYIEHYEKKYMMRSISGMLINIVLNYLLIQICGMAGAAMATLITLIVISYVYDLFDRELRRFYLLKIKGFVPKLKG